MSQLAQLSEAEIEERFHVLGRTAIQFMLAGFARDKVAFTVRFGDDEAQFPTRLLGVLPDKGQLVFDCSGSSELNRQYGDAEQAVISGRPGGIQVQFAVGPAVDIYFEGAKAFAVALPARLLRLQRRESFRVDTPRLHPLEFFGRASDGQLIKLPTHDISVSGVGLMAPSPPETLVLGQRLDNCRLVLPDEREPLFFTAQVQHITALEGRGTAPGQWRIGLHFAALPFAEQNHIQRYIVRIEHERRELS